MSNDLNPNPTSPTGNITPNYTFPVISVDGILSSREFFLSKETYDRGLLHEIATIPTETLYPRLVEWASHGFQPQFQLINVTLRPPTSCSDGVVRTFADYIDFLAGDGGHMKVVTQLQSRFQDIVLTTSYEDNNVNILVTKQQ